MTKLNSAEDKQQRRKNHGCRRSPPWVDRRVPGPIDRPKPQDESGEKADLDNYRKWQTCHDY